MNVDDKKRRFLINVLRGLAGIGILGLLRPFFSSWLPNAKTRLQGSPLRVSLSALHPGEMMTVVWRGKPIWIVRRTPEMLVKLAVPNKLLRDPDSLTPQQPAYAKNVYRSVDPEYLVLVGLCTHLGCTPRYEPQRGEGGFFCPCHGSCFDLSGRVFKEMPAPVNLEVPPYRIVDKDWIEIGEVTR